MSIKHPQPKTEQPTTEQPTSDRPGGDARARVAEARAAEALRRRRRKGLIVGAAAVAVIVAGTGIGIAVQDSRTTSNAPYVAPANADGTVIVYGNPNAKNTLQVYEDFRCPICDELEKSAGPAIQALADKGTYKIEYHMATFLDGNLGGNGSAVALNAAAAALNEGTATFKAFHDELYANQPPETSDGFNSTAEMLKLAAKVPGLVTPAFTKAVQDNTYGPWVTKVSDAFNTSGVTGTPTLKLNGTQLNVFSASGTPVTQAQFTAVVDAALAGK
ncbi:thioredoxin domain-containing protein [Streptacidiphilus sp. P02-A3a]|uniref:DsbA family protein n=1 Tax=Streptacidiphilus sp. P02-A3a TaxID=2704468 RepID=UPI0015FD13B2|nr:thioredoxin domain-containing protein [Streptacidiphilus sp. P02-A3a]QMU68579.1 thioredoxin domain-containing protein [Streptacidiphilus sp. P02-A3a]